jgi:formylmethanofuran dehydrogenase subunit E
MTTDLIETLPSVEVREAPSVIITPLYEERADSRPVYCDQCRDVTIQDLRRTANGREYVCPVCQTKTVYLIVRPGGREAGA